MQSSASSFNVLYPLLSLKSSSSCLHLPLHPITSIFPSLTRFRRQIRRKVSPDISVLLCSMYWYFCVQSQYIQIFLSHHNKCRYFYHIMVCMVVSMPCKVFSEAYLWNETLFLFQQLKGVEGCLLSDRWRPCTTHFLCGSLIHSWTLWHLPRCSERQHHHLPRTHQRLSHQLHLCHPLCSTCNHPAAVSILVHLCRVISPF